MFKSDTWVYYCCMTDPLVKEGIVLPRDKPFYLFPFGSKDCQPVVGTKVTLERIQWDLENDLDGGASKPYDRASPYTEIIPEGKHLVTYYCHYEPSNKINFISFTYFSYLLNLTIILSKNQKLHVQCWATSTEAFLEPSRISTMELFESS